MLVFHGNAGPALHRLYFVAGFQALGKSWEVFLCEYPGYGSRPGSPSESAIKSAMDFSGFMDLNGCYLEEVA